MQTVHQFIHKYPIAETSQKLILGTIHPHFTEEFEIPFFYGNRSSLWKILQQAFPPEFRENLNLKAIETFLENRNIAISDTIKVCRRKNPTALDSDLIPEILHTELKESISNSAITEIFFTSGFQKNNAFKLFYEDILGLKLTKEIKVNKCAILDKSFFGREVKLTLLVSPSGAANISLSKSPEYLKNEHRFLNSKRPVHDFKVECYQKAFTI